MSEAKKGGEENLYNKDLAKKICDTKDEQLQDSQEQKSTMNPGILVSASGKQQTLVTRPKAELASQSVGGTRKNDNNVEATTRADTSENQDSKGDDNNNDDDDDAWETEEEAIPKIIQKRKQRRRGQSGHHRLPPWYSSFDMYDSNGYEPELFMGDPRDREVAEILYGPGAGYNPRFFSGGF